MAEGHGMIEPFAAEQVRTVNGHRIVSYGTSSYGYDVRCAPEFKIFTNINSTIVDPEGLRPRVICRSDRRGLHHPAELVRTGAHRRILPDPAQRPDDLPRQVDLRALRHHRQRDTARAGMGGPRDSRVLQYHAFARQDLCKRGRGADAVFRIRRNLRRVVSRPRRQVHGSAGRDAAEGLSVGAIRPVAARRAAAAAAARGSPTRGRGVSPSRAPRSRNGAERKRVPRTCCRRAPDRCGIAESSRQPFAKSARDVQLRGRRPASRLGYHRVHAPARDPTVASASRRLDRVSRGPKPRLNNRR